MGLAQISSKTGDVAANISRHVEFIRKVADQALDLIIFPELSLTAYEPKLAKEMAMAVTDNRLEIFQQLSIEYKMVIGIGLPEKCLTGVKISMLLFCPDNTRQTYAKTYLHEDELPYFVPGKNKKLTLDYILDFTLGLAICYELSVANHVATVTKLGVNGYLASVAKTKAGVEEASKQLSNLANKHNMYAFMANSVGIADDVQMSGQSGIWGPDGSELGRLNANDEGILICDIPSKGLKQVIIK